MNFIAVIIINELDIYQDLAKKKEYLCGSNHSSLGQHCYCTYVAKVIKID